MFNSLKKRAIKILKGIEDKESQKIIKYLEDKKDVLEKEFKRYGKQILNKIDIFPFIVLLYSRLTRTSVKKYLRIQNGGTRHQLKTDFENWFDGPEDDDEQYRGLDLRELRHSWIFYPEDGIEDGVEDGVEESDAFDAVKRRDVASALRTMYHTQNMYNTRNRLNRELQFENHYRVIFFCAYIFIFVCWLTTIGVGGGTSISSFDAMLRGSGGLFWTLFAGLLIPLGIGGRSLNTFIRYLSYTQDEWEDHIERYSSPPSRFGGRKKTRKRHRKKAKNTRKKRKFRRRKRTRKRRKRKRTRSRK